jgi:parvulin-like peptidyl-prolyl isomerase
MKNRVRSSISGRARAAICALTVLAAATLSGPALAADPSPDVVARLGATDFTAAQLGGFVRSLEPAMRKQALADPQIMNRLVRSELARIAVLNEAAAKKWEQRPEIVAEIARARDQTIVTTYLASLTTPPADYPPDADIQSAYDLNRDSFMVPRQYHLAQIYIALPAGGDKTAVDAAQKKAQDLAQKAKAKGASFEDLARANSDHKDSAAHGGDMGWAPENEITQEIRGPVAGMSAGEISDPIRAPDGWHIIRMMETKPAAPLPLAEVKDRLITLLRQRKMQENEQAYLAALLEKTPVAVNEIGLRKLFEAAP